MANIDQDALPWTVVVNKRRGRYPARPRRPSQFPVPSACSNVAVLEVEQNEDLILRRLKRSMECLQKSEFFEKFLQQVQRPCVLDRLQRSASITTTECCVCPGEENLGKASVRNKCTGTDVNIDQSVLGISLIKQDGKKSSFNCASRGGQTDKEKSGAALCSKQAENNVPSKECYKERAENVPSSEGGRETDGSIYHDDLSPSSKEGVEGKHVISCDRELLHPKNVVSRDAGKDWTLQIITYGLGSIAESEVSRCQFALILLLKERFSWVDDIQIYDPVLSRAECKAIEAMGCLTIGSNDEGRRTICRPTIFYMPHCEDWLYDNVLQANWMPQKLEQLVFLGNSFQNYQEAWSSFHASRSKTPPTYVLKFHQSAKEIPLEATSSLGLPAFNNMSWYFYQEHDLPSHHLKQAFS